MATETLHGALKTIILSTVCSLEWEAECWQKVMCLETAGKCDRMMLFPHYIHSTLKATASFFPLSVSIPQKVYTRILVYFCTHYLRLSHTNFLYYSRSTVAPNFKF